MRKIITLLILLIAIVFAACSYGNDSEHYDLSASTEHEHEVVGEANDSTCEYLDEIEGLAYNYEDLPPSTGRIFLFGEQHASGSTKERQLEIWSEFYHNYGMRHLFIETPYFSAQLLNMWMQIDGDDTILYKWFENLHGTMSDNPYTMAFYRYIKENLPETVFHGTDVGHQSDTTGQLFLQHLIDNNLQDTESYRLTHENIAQFRHFIEQNRSHAVRTSHYKPRNFIREFDRLGNQDIMAIHGRGHVHIGNFGSYSDAPTMATILRERYGDALQIFDMLNYALLQEPYHVETMIVGGVEFEASFFGKCDARFSNIIGREFWRLENAYEHLRYNRLMGATFRFDNFPMPVETGQVFVIDFHRDNGTIDRWFYRSSEGVYWNGRPAAQRFMEYYALSEPYHVEIMTIGGIEFEALFYGRCNLMFRNVVGREFWRLENAYEYFSHSPATGTVFPFDNFPMQVEIGQVYIVDIHFDDGTVTRGFYRSSESFYWEGRPSTQGFRPPIRLR